MKFPYHLSRVEIFREFDPVLSFRSDSLVAEKCKKSSFQSVRRKLGLATKISFTATFLEEKRFHHYVGIT